MPNTVIALKKSATPSAVPSSLANGELAINFADGKLFYKAANGTIVQFASGGTTSNSFSTVNANGTLVVAASATDVLSLRTGNNITIVGDAVNDRVTIGLSNDVILPGVLYIQAVGGDEGGQLELGNAITNSTLAGNVVIDIYQNRLRFYEKGSPNKGAYIDLSISQSGVGSNLLAGGSATDTVAREIGSSAFDKANAVAISANAWTNTVFGYTNTSIGTANTWANTVAGYANTWANTIVAGANGWTNTVFGYTNTRIGVAFNAANNAQYIANLAFDKANTGGGGYYQGNNGDRGASNFGDIFRSHSNTLSTNVTIYSGNNSLAAGPITITTGQTVIIQTGARMVIV